MNQSMTLQQALENVSHELDILARKATAIDEAMGRSISDGDQATGLSPELTQDVDLIRQSADCLHIVMTNLTALTAATPQPPAHVEAQAMIRGVYLSAIRQRVTAAPVIERAEMEDMGDWIDL